MKRTGEGLRINEGKTRHDLVPSYAQEQYAKVLTIGATKYAEHNWERGMKWSKVLASLKRHILAFERGEDYDPETGLLHMAHAMCNAAFITEYYKIYPMGDDRAHKYLDIPKIGLDVDEVLADFVGAYTDLFGMDTPYNWSFDTQLFERISQLPIDFWMQLKPKVDPKTLPFEPHCYVTSRSIPSEWTEKWLYLNGFPHVPVYTVKHGESKLEVVRNSGVDIFVDDRFETFAELNANGICCFLMDAKHNRRYDVGFKRIHSLSEII